MKRIIMALVLVTALVAGPTALAATKTTKKKHKVTLDASVQSHAVNAQGTDAGTATDPVLGSGATVYTLSGTASAEHVVFQAWFATGSIKGTGTVALGTAANGKTPITGTGNVTGGTGKYKGSKGKVSFNGSVDSGTLTTPGTGDVSFTVTGSFSY